MAIAVLSALQAATVRTPSHSNNEGIPGLAPAGGACRVCGGALLCASLVPPNPNPTPPPFPP